MTPPHTPESLLALTKSPEVQYPKGVRLSVEDYEHARQCVNLLAPHPDLSAVEVHSKETMDEVRAAMKNALHEMCQTTALCDSFTLAVDALDAALAKLNSPQ